MVFTLPNDDDFVAGVVDELDDLVGFGHHVFYSVGHEGNEHGGGGSVLAQWGGRGHPVHGDCLDRDAGSGPCGVLEAPGSPQELRAGDQGHSGLSGPLTALGSAQGLE